MPIKKVGGVEFFLEKKYSFIKLLGKGAYGVVM